METSGNTANDNYAGGSGADWLEAALAGIPRARVAVFGDFCLDAYWQIDPDQSELSVETRLPVRRVRQQRYSLGGAGNIVANLSALGVRRISAIGLMADDMFGQQMAAMLKDLRVNVEGMLLGDGWQTHVYVKPMIGGAEQDRLDFGAFNTLAPAAANELAKCLDRAAGACDLVVLNQQVPSGISTPEMIERVNAVVSARPRCRFIVDSRHRAELYRGCMLKLNAHEAARLLGEGGTLAEHIHSEQAVSLAGRLHGRTGKTVFLTCGENGLVVADADGCTVVPGVSIAGPIDPVGAGDTALSAIAATLACGQGALAAGRLANIAASVTVRKLGATGTASPEEIRQVAHATGRT